VKIQRKDYCLPSDEAYRINV